MAYKTKFIPENASKYIGDPARIICRSLWERKVCKWMDSNLNVIRWGSEELAILIEVKPKKQTVEPKKRKTKTYLQESMTFKINTSKWKAAENFCKKQGWKFLIMTEDHIFPKSK